MQDVAPLSLGIELNGDIMDVVIARNTSIPIKKTKGYSTSIDNQTAASIKVYEGERARASDNNLLGSFSLSVRRAPRGQPLEVCFTINENGILNVSANEKSTGSKIVITVTNDKERLSSQEITKMIGEAEHYRVEDEKFLRKANVMNALDYCVYKMKNALKKIDVNLKLSSQENHKINSAITKAKSLC